eukprot:GHVP01039046.1.p1 GENE.GHVP01039046.1~~GHVP01039046.1.p1  ORF type:complete len:227 (-),score=22.50 GHVP01039046.1:13-693(-)
MIFIKISLKLKQSLINYLQDNEFKPVLEATERDRYRKLIKICFLSKEPGAIYIRYKGMGTAFFATEEEEERSKVIKKLHCTSHIGKQRTLENLRKRWDGITREQVLYTLRDCQECIDTKILQTREILRPILTKTVRQRLMVELIDLRRYSSLNDGYFWILVSIDCFSKFVISVPLRTKSADEVSRTIETIFFSHAILQTVHTDNGKEFRNKKIQGMCEKLETRHVF